MSAAPIDAISALMSSDPALTPASTVGKGPHASGASFSQMIWNGIEQANKKTNDADAMVTAFALDDSIPPHQVMFALEQAQHSMSLILQVRGRLMESYQELMRMQL